MVILVLSCEINQELGVTLGALNGCGFRTQVAERCDLCKIDGPVIIIGKHPQKKHNGDVNHRRRFTGYEVNGIRGLGYAEGAEIDPLWWKDLYYKLRSFIKEEIPQEDYHSYYLPLLRLREKSL